MLPLFLGMQRLMCDLSAFRYIYWSEYGYIEGAEMDGENRRTVADLSYWAGSYDARGLALDVKTNRIYFVSYYLERLLYIDLDSAGHNQVNLLLEDSVVLYSPRGVALDDQFVYWNEFWTENVYRINKTAFDGRLDVVASGFYSPRGMAIKLGNPSQDCEFIYS